jgi:hypothetical protein
LRESARRQIERAERYDSSALMRELIDQARAAGAG